MDVIEHGWFSWPNRASAEEPVSFTLARICGFGGVLDLAESDEDADGKAAALMRPSYTIRVSANSRAIRREQFSPTLLEGICHCLFLLKCQKRIGSTSS